MCTLLKHNLCNFCEQDLLVH